MIRREACVGLTAMALSALVVGAPTRSKPWRLGVLGVQDTLQVDGWLGFVAELTQRGYVEGKSLVVVNRHCDERLERLEPLAKELVGLGVDVILSASPDALPYLKRATQSIPIVMTSSPDPVGDGWIASLAHPGGNITGNTVSVEEIELKQLELLVDVLRTPKRVAYVVYQPFQGRPRAIQHTARMEATARGRGVKLETRGAVDGRALDGIFDSLAHSGFEGVVLQNHATIGIGYKEVAVFCLRNRMPIIMRLRGNATVGVPFTFGVSDEYQFRRAAIYVDRILSGAKPADLPVELPTQFELVVNLKTTAALGLHIPSSVLLRANELIQ